MITCIGHFCKKIQIDQILMEKALIAFIPLHAFQVIHNIIILQNIGGRSVRLAKKGFNVGLYFGKEKT